jgi:hypothetical protein
MYNFTPEDLIQYHYGELDAHLVPVLKNALSENWSLNQKYSVLEEATRRLDKSFYSPRKESIDSILAYANATVGQAIAE